MVLEAFFLNLPGFDDSLTDGCGGFSGFHFGELCEGHSLQFNQQVKPIHQWTADFGEIAVDLSWCADAMMERVAIVAAGTGVHGGDQHEGARVFHCGLCPGDGDSAVF